MTLGVCAGLIAPYYNLALAIIVFILFYNLFSIKRPKGYLYPWKLLFIAVSIFVFQSILTVLSGLSIITFPHIIFPIFEMIMILLFTYMLLLQREKLK